MKGRRSSMNLGYFFLLMCHPLSEKIDDNRRYDMYGTKPVQIGRTKKKEMFFASDIIQKYHGGSISPRHTHIKADSMMLLKNY